MLSPEQETRIEERFRDENLWLLNTYASRMDVDRIYRTYFTPREAVASYSNMSETDLIYRCLGIILESIAFTGDQVASGDTKIPSPNVPITSVPSDPFEA